MSVQKRLPSYAHSFCLLLDGQQLYEEENLIVKSINWVPISSIQTEKSSIYLFKCSRIYLRQFRCATGNSFKASRIAIICSPIDLH